MSQLYSSSQACKITSVTYRQLDYWIRIGVIIPFVNPKGSGKERKFDYDNLIKLKTAKVLFELGINSDLIKIEVGHEEIYFDYVKVSVDTNLIQHEIDTKIGEL